MYFDSHAHLNDRKYENDLDEIIDNAFKSGVKYIIINGYDIASSQKAIDIAQQYENIYATVGLHPGDVEQFSDKTITSLEELAMSNKVVAIGEIGLDYHYEPFDKQLQHKVFKLQLELAKKLDLPVTIHSRDAINDTFNILEQSNNYGVMHCYSDSVEYAKKFVEIGFHISLAGPVTFKNARKAKEVAKGISIDKLLIETDCPYLTPHPFRGERNEPKNVYYVAKEIAEIKNLDISEVGMITTKNAQKLFKIDMEGNDEII